MNYLDHYRESMPTVLPYLHLEGYILMRQCLHDPNDYFSDESRKHLDDRDYLEELAYSDIDRQASALVAPLGLAVNGGIRVLRSNGEQGLVTRTEFVTKLQRYLGAEYRTAAKNIKEDYEYVPVFPFAGKLLLRTLINGPNGKRAVEQMKKQLEREALL